MFESGSGRFLTMTSLMHCFRLMGYMVGMVSGGTGMMVADGAACLMVRCSGGSVYRALVVGQGVACRHVQLVAGMNQIGVGADGGGIFFVEFWPVFAAA